MYLKGSELSEKIEQLKMIAEDRKITKQGAIIAGNTRKEIEEKNK